MPLEALSAKAHPYKWLWQLKDHHFQLYGRTLAATLCFPLPFCFYAFFWWCYIMPTQPQ